MPNIIVTIGKPLMITFDTKHHRYNWNIVCITLVFIKRTRKTLVEYTEWTDLPFHQ